MGEDICDWHRVCQSGQPVTGTGKANVLKVKEIIGSHNIYTIRDIAKAVSHLVYNFYTFDLVFALLYGFYLICYMNSIYI